MVEFYLGSIKDLKVLIDHFDKTPLITQKLADYLLWKRVVELVSNKEHLTREGLEKIVAIKASINRGLTNKLLEAFPNVTPWPRDLITNKKILDPKWIAGFVSAEGCFMIKIHFKQNLISQVLLVFQITQHKRDELLMRSLIEYFNCGKVYNRDDAYDFRVTKFSDLVTKIVPFFQNYPIQGVKHKDYLDWCKAVELIRNKDHLTKEGVGFILKLKEGMNTGRKERY